MLGAPGCRCALTELASAVSSFGKKFLTAARDFFAARGHRVLYGDTDSVFVLAGLPGGGRPTPSCWRREIATHPS